ncbi:MAG: DUF2238 domain-containing protein [Rhodoferax sp.]|nr:DUF2238 domain-containing protein [Rhodoferax sp.]
MQRTPILVISLAVLLALLAWSGWQPYDRATWLLEVFPIFVVVPLLLLTYSRLPLSSLLYLCIFLHAVILLVGGAYTYARVPLGFQIAEALGLHRNPYDKIGHFAQGFVPALATREILLRLGRISKGKLLNVLVVCVALAVSASYELVEWAAALALGQGADEFLGTQGDPWDTQSDMFFAFVGATVAVLGFARIQDSQLFTAARS